LSFYFFLFFIIFFFFFFSFSFFNPFTFYYLFLRVVVRRALARAGGNVSEAARTLGVSRATLHRKMSRHRQREA
jgi:transcriptional regulator with AAA-type ATPase domain